MRLLSYNVWSGLNYQGLVRMGSLETPLQREERYRLLVEELRALRPDVVAINEANPLPDYLRRLARDLDYSYVWHPGVSGVRLGPLALPMNLVEGDGLLARKELGLEWVGRRQLTGGPVGRYASFNLGNATQVVAARAGGIYLLVTHWTVASSALDYRTQTGSPQAAQATHSRAAARRWRESELTLQAARRWIPPGSPAVLLGDLNTHPDAPELDPWRAAGWTDAFRHLHPQELGATWDQARNPRIHAHYPPGYAPLPERIDYVWVNAPLRECLGSAQVVLDKPAQPSDHFGVLVELLGQSTW